MYPRNSWILKAENWNHRIHPINCRLWETQLIGIDCVFCPEQFLSTFHAVLRQNKHMDWHTFTHITLDGDCKCNQLHCVIKKITSAKNISGLFFLLTKASHIQNTVFHPPDCAIILKSIWRRTLVLFTVSCGSFYPGMQHCVTYSSLIGRFSLWIWSSGFCWV